jgi:hypothetical protein
MARPLMRKTKKLERHRSIHAFADGRDEEAHPRMRRISAGSR